MTDPGIRITTTNENWRGKNDPAERRRIQNRLNQRAFRERQRSGEARKSASPQKQTQSDEEGKDDDDDKKKGSDDGDDDDDDDDDEEEDEDEDDEDDDEADSASDHGEINVPPHEDLDDRSTSASL